MYKILLVDDDLALLESNRNYFVKRGYHVLCTDCAKQAMAMIETVTLDCVVLDIDLPDGDGFEVCARARETTSVPIVFLSAYTETECRVRGLSMGGDDYLCKPFSLEELELRVRLRIKRRDSGADEKVLRFGELTINSATRQVYVGHSMEISPALSLTCCCFLPPTRDRCFPTSSSMIGSGSSLWWRAATICKLG